VVSTSAANFKVAADTLVSITNASYNSEKAIYNSAVFISTNAVAALKSY
jgi:hypothetical protein